LAKHNMVARLRWAGAHKVWCFSFLSHILFVCKNGNAIKQYNFQNNYGAIS